MPNIASYDSAVTVRNTVLLARPGCNVERQP